MGLQWSFAPCRSDQWYGSPSQCRAFIVIDDMICAVYQSVTQLYQKSVESKPAAQEGSRARSLGRTRKEYPAFDINPKLAKECFDRIRARKGEENGAMKRPPCEEEERLEAISFQGDAEEYSPWKDIPVEEEKEKAAEDRPLSWAELARKKQNQGNGAVEKGQGPKGMYSSMQTDVHTLTAHHRSC